MSYQNQAPVSYPPPGTAYPAPASSDHAPPPPTYAPPPPAGYPTAEYPQKPPAAVPVETKSRGDGFWKGCCAGLCCCCVVEECCF